MKELVKSIISGIGDNPLRAGLEETPERVVRSWQYLFSGYSKNVGDVVKVFPRPNPESPGQIILLKDIEFYSTCEHHMLPFFGKAHVAYIPDTVVIGVSKLARIIEIFSRRLQIQERIGEQVTSSLMLYLKPKAAACVLDAIHLCMAARGVEKQNSRMITSSLKGTFLEDIRAREELMRLIQ